MIVSLCMASTLCRAAIYSLSEAGGDLVGQLDEVSASAEDTLLDIARHFDLGYNEIVAANPDIDPWLPTAGARVVIPSYFILPSAPRDGIVINLAEMRLYYFSAEEQDGPTAVDKVMTYPIGIGQEGWSTPEGVTTVTEKIADPAWTVPDSIIEDYAREGHVLPKIMPPGPDNPLGNFALRLAMPRFLIHGTNKPFGVGRRISHGCIRMYPEDIEELFNHVKVGTRVWIVDQPYKIGVQKGYVMLEAHEPITDSGMQSNGNLAQIISTASAIADSRQKNAASETAMQVALRHSGIPRQITQVDNQQDAVTGWVLQLGAFTDMRNAMNLAEKITSLAVPVSIKARAIDGYCHVMAGPYETQDSALEDNARLEKSIGLTGKLLPANRYGMIADCQP